MAVMRENKTRKYRCKGYIILIVLSLNCNYNKKWGF